MNNSPELSFEFFPPREMVEFDKELDLLSDLGLKKVSITSGAGGSKKQRTLDTARHLVDRGFDVTVHLTCRNASASDIRAVIDEIEKAGISDILALRGDAPWEGHGDFDHATQLVELIRKNYPDFRIGVAGYPEGHPDTPNRMKDLEYLKAKVDAGADYIVTQLCYDNRLIHDFTDQCALLGIRIPVIVGIMPLSSKTNLQRMAGLSGRCNFPSALLRAVERTSTPEQVKKLGIHWAAEQVRDLMDSETKAIRIYTLNNVRDSLKIFDSIGINPRLS